MIRAGRDFAGRLVGAQSPQWAGLALAAAGCGGTDNVVYRLAADSTVDTGLVTEAWDAAIAAPAWDRAPVWVHADKRIAWIASSGAGTALVIRGTE